MRDNQHMRGGGAQRVDQGLALRRNFDVHAVEFVAPMRRHRSCRAAPDAGGTRARRFRFAGQRCDEVQVVGLAGLNHVRYSKTPRPESGRIDDVIHVESQSRVVDAGGLFLVEECGPVRPRHALYDITSIEWTSEGGDRLAVGPRANRTADTDRRLTGADLADFAHPTDRIEELRGRVDLHRPCRQRQHVLA